MELRSKALKRIFIPVLICFSMVFSQASAVFAESDDGNTYGYYDENGNYIPYADGYIDADGNWVDTTGSDDSGEEEETEFIPEEYYDPIQTNEIKDWPEGPAVQAAGVIVEDLDTGTILYSKNADKKYYPASITKILTTMLALESGIDLDTKVTCGDEVNEIEDDASNLYAQPGEEFTLRQLLYGVMLASANEMANTVAVTVSGSMQDFADLMNKRAAELGCTGSHFVNPNGLHNDDHYTTAGDFAKICAEAYKNDTFREIISTAEYTIPPTNLTDEERTFTNHHRMIQEDSEYYEEWCRGGKTGYTDSAWNTLVTYGEKEDKRLVCIILHENGPDRAVTETTDLMNYGFDNFTDASVTQNTAVPTFSQLMDVESPEGSVIYSSEKLDEPVYTVTKPGIVTIPVGTEISSLEQHLSGSMGTITYTFNGWTVGSGEISFTSLPEDVTYPYEQERNMDQLLSEAQSEVQNRENVQTAQKAIDQLVDLKNSVVSKTTEYIQNNRMTVILIGAFLLVIVIILIIIIVLRCTKDLRIERKRKKDELQIERQEQEIDRKSAIEIEEELREAMENERRKQEEADARKAEEEKREQELLENEKIVDEAMKDHNSVRNQENQEDTKV